MAKPIILRRTNGELSVYEPLDEDERSVIRYASLVIYNGVTYMFRDSQEQYIGFSEVVATVQLAGTTAPWEA